jgi:hypothetical protein
MKVAALSLLCITFASQAYALPIDTPDVSTPAVSAEAVSSANSVQTPSNDNVEEFEAIAAPEKAKFDESAYFFNRFRSAVQAKFFETKANVPE